MDELIVTMPSGIKDTAERRARSACRIGNFEAQSGAYVANAMASWGRFVVVVGLAFRNDGVVVSIVGPGMVRYTSSTVGNEL